MSVNFSEVYRKIELTVEKTSFGVSNLADESFLLKFTGHNHESILKTNININVYRYGRLSRLRGRIGLLSFGVKLSDDFSLRKSFTAITSAPASNKEVSPSSLNRRTNLSSR